jgi:hypothetical protein
MGRRQSEWGPPLREYWQQINRAERTKEAELRAKRKTRDKKRPKCRCDAYKFPHRPGGGLCRYPDPPVVRWQDAQVAEIAQRVAKFKKMLCGEPTPEQLEDLTAMTTKPCRPYRDRYAGLRRQIARNNGLHPIRDRDLIDRFMSQVRSMAKQAKREAPRAKYRNMKIILRQVSPTETGMTVQAQWQIAGPLM